jgi:hypothetical protein
MIRMGHTRAVALALALLCAGWQATPLHAQTDTFFVMQPSQTSGIAAATVTRNTFRLPDGTEQLDILLKITAGGTATGTLTIFLEDSVDGGTTWDDVVSSLSFALGAAAVNQRFFISTAIVPSVITTAASTNITQGSTNTTETMAAGSARQGPIGVLWRVREKIAGPAGSPVGATYTITARLKVGI